MSLGLKAQFKSNAKRLYVKALYDRLRRNSMVIKPWVQSPAPKKKKKKKKKKLFHSYTARITKHLCVPRSVTDFLLTMGSTHSVLKCPNQPGVMVHTYTLDTKSTLKAILGSTMNSRPAWPTKEDLVTREESK
jgi:hypothetical protein